MGVIKTAEEGGVLDGVEDEEEAVGEEERRVFTEGGVGGAREETELLLRTREEALVRPPRAR